MIGHGTRDEAGRQSLLDFAAAYQAMDRTRPVLPCFLELTGPTIQQGVDQCVEQGYTELSVLPILLFAARHNKFDVTNELDRARQRHPQVKFHYGRHFGITPGILELWRSRLAELVKPQWNRSDTVLLFVGRGSSDPDANGDVCKLAVFCGKVAVTQLLKPVSLALPTLVWKKVSAALDSTNQNKLLFCPTFCLLVFGQKDLRHHRPTAGAIPGYFHELSARNGSSSPVILCFTRTGN
jgi:hypothetical protein